MEYILFLITFILISLTIYSNYMSSPEGITEKRMTHLSGLKKESMRLRQELEGYTKRKVKFSRRYKIETILAQAGFFKTSYSDFVLISLISSFFGFLFSSLISYNILLGVLFAVIFFRLPTEIIHLMKNSRIAKIEGQIGSFMYMLIKRYQQSVNFERSLILTMEEFKGAEPMYSELVLTVAQLRSGLTESEVLNNLARRVDSPYLYRLADYYRIASEVGTKQIREDLLMQAFDQFEENRKLKELLKKEISEPVRDSYIMLGVIPIFAIFGVMSFDGYLDFWRNTLVGQIALSVIVVLCIGILYFINNKIGGSLNKKKDKEEKK